MEENRNDLPIPPVEKKVNPFMLLPNALQGLKSVEKHRFAEEDFFLNELAWKKNVTERMRALDDSRMRTPTDKECSELNIPNDRLNIHSMKSILLLCGGCVGVRFTSEELQQLDLLTASCEEVYKKVDFAFKAIPQKARTRRLKGQYNSNYSDSTASDISAVSGLDGLCSGIVAVSSSISIAEKLDDVTITSGETAVSTIGTTGTTLLTAFSEDLDAGDLIHLHLLLDSYFELVRRIQNLVKMKNERVPSEAERSEKGYSISISFDFNYQRIFLCCNWQSLCHRHALLSFIFLMKRILHFHFFLLFSTFL